MTPTTPPARGRRTTLWLTPEDDAILAKLKRRTGATQASAVIKAAIRAMHDRRPGRPRKDEER